MNEKRALTRAIGLGALAGMRSIAAPALLSRYAARDNAWPNGLDMAQTPFAVLGSSVAPPVLGVLAAGEMSGDKMPAAPDRTSPLALAARAGSGAIVGGAIFAAEDEKPLKGALIGAGVAVAAAFVSLAIRKGLNDKAHIPDKFLGIGEDLLVGVVGAILLKSSDS